MNKMNEKTVTRPLCLELDDAKAEIFAAVNMTSKKHNIPFYLLESIVNEAARQVSNLAKAERETAAADYERQIAEMQKGEGDNAKP